MVMHHVAHISVNAFWYRILTMATCFVVHIIVFSLFGLLYMDLEHINGPLNISINKIKIIL